MSIVSCYFIWFYQVYIYDSWLCLIILLSGKKTTRNANCLLLTNERGHDFSQLALVGGILLYTLHIPKT